MHSSSGHESSGVHVCNKCGWPFPKLHPSARHRRSHKKICGTIEGYELVDSQEIAAISDEDHLSDEDHRTPSPKPEEKIDSEKGRDSRTGERSNKSEDELFSDAVTEFSDTGFRPGTEEPLEDARPVESNVEKITARNLTMFYSFKDNAIAGSNLETQLTQVHDSSSTEEPATTFSDDKNELAWALHPIKPETRSSESQENITINASADVAEGLMAYVGQETDAKGNDKVYSDMVTDMLLPNEYADRPSETESESQEIKEMTSHPFSADGVLSKEDNGHAMAANMSSSDLTPGSESVEHLNFIDTVPVNVNAEQKLDHPIKPETRSSESQENITINASADVAEGLMAYVGQETDAKGNDKVNSDMVTDMLLPNEYADRPSETESKSQEIKEMTSHPLSADGVLSKEDNGNAMAANMSSSDLTPGSESVEHLNFIDTVPVNVNAEQKLDLSSSVNSIECYTGKGEENDNVQELSVPADIPVVDHAEIKLGGFKDHKGVKLNNFIDADSLEIIKDKKDDVEYPVPKPSASDLNVSRDNLMHGGSMPTVEKQSIEGENDVHQIKLSSIEKSDELGTPVASVIIETEKTLPDGSVEKPLPYVCGDSLHNDFPETAVNPMTAPDDANDIGLYDAGNHKKAISETNDVAGNDENKIAEEGNNDKNRTTISESATYRPEILANPTTNLHKSDDVGDHENGKIDNSAAMGVERGDEFAEKKLSLRTIPASEYATSLHKLEVVADDVMDMTAMKLTETKLGNLDSVSNTQDVTEQLEISGNDKAQEKRVVDSERGVEQPERTSDAHATKAPLVFPFGTESSMQSYVAVGGGDSVSNLSLQGENIDNNFVKHHLGASPVDVSVDSLSQTGSLEANWGSISVLSTQSDTPVDAETLPSTAVASAETEKSNMKAKGATEGGRQHSSKSDIFEAPSFMTLVEPGGEVNHNTAAAQTQTIQNPEQQNAASLQAGWFPSLTHVSNESEGRKKNEEIIAKVTNWSTGKQRAPLKNLLGEAKHDARPKENQARVVWKDETVSENNGAAATTVSSILGPEDTKRATGKEGTSPAARYPVDIKREKRKVKGRPYWVQFMCCSSVK